MSKSNYDKFLDTYHGKQLLSQYSLSEIGLWHIRGEDPNCDMGGSHIMPNLGYAQGTLRSVIEYAVDLPSFWQWGSGGDITKIQSIKLDPENLKRITLLKQERLTLQERITTITTELRELGAEK